MKDDKKTKKQLVQELTELRSQNDVLKKSESAEKYRSLVENIREVIYELDSQGVVLYISPAIRDMLGYDSAEMVGKNFIELSHKDDKSNLEEWFSELRKGQEYPSEYRVINKSGEFRWARTKTRPIMEEGQFKGAQGILIDVTEQKRAEEKLRETEKRYRDLYDFLPIPVYEMDLETNITSANRAIYETFRGTEEDLKKGVKGWQLLSPEEIEKSSKNIERLLKGEPVEGTEYTLMRLDGSVFPAIVISRVIYSDGKPVGLRGAIVDITERKRAENALRASEEWFRKIFEEAHQVGIVIAAPSFVFEKANPAFCRMMGYSADELRSMTFANITHPDHLKQDMENVKKVGRGEIPFYQTEKQYINKSGKVLWGNLIVSSIRDEHGALQYFLSMVIDITKQKRAMDLLLEATDKYQGPRREYL